MRWQHRLHPRKDRDRTCTRNSTNTQSATLPSPPPKKRIAQPWSNARAATLSQPSLRHNVQVTRKHCIDSPNAAHHLGKQYSRAGMGSGLRLFPVVESNPIGQPAAHNVITAQGWVAVTCKAGGHVRGWRNLRWICCHGSCYSSLHFLASPAHGPTARRAIESLLRACSSAVILKHNAPRCK
jgi:hypothetical protein